MKIILSGGGDPQDVRPLDEYFVRSLDPEKPVLYIPIAMEPEVHTHEECLAWFRETYGVYGLSTIEMCTDLTALTLDSRYGAVFIGGGNTFKLLDKIQQSGFGEQLHAYLESGGILYGGSAGAIICGRTIQPATCLDKNDISLEDLRGLNLLGGYDIFCHYEEKYEPYINSYPGGLYILYEESGLVFDGDTVSSLGKPFLTKEA